MVSAMPGSIWFFMTRLLGYGLQLLQAFLAVWPRIARRGSAAGSVAAFRIRAADRTVRAGIGGRRETPARDAVRHGERLRPQRFGHCGGQPQQRQLALAGAGPARHIRALRSPTVVLIM
jgi:hypothetical protein